MRKSSAKATEINYQFEITWYGISSHFSNPASTLDKLRAFDGFISALDKRLQTCWINYIISVSATVRGKGENRITFTELMLIEEEKDIYFVWVWNLVADIAGVKEAEGVWEHGVEENICT